MYSFPGAGLCEIPISQETQFGPASNYPNAIQSYEHPGNYSYSPQYSPSAPQEHPALGPQSGEKATNQGSNPNQIDDLSQYPKVPPPQGGYGNLLVHHPNPEGNYTNQVPQQLVAQSGQPPAHSPSLVGNCMNQVSPQTLVQTTREQSVTFKLIMQAMNAMNLDTSKMIQE